MSKKEEEATMIRAPSSFPLRFGGRPSSVALEKLPPTGPSTLRHVRAAVSQTTTTTAGSKNTTLRRVLELLPPDQSLFCVPLQHKYSADDTTTTTGGLSLQGPDRVQQQAIANATGGDWDMVVAEVGRVDLETGDRYHGHRLDVTDTEEGPPFFSGPIYSLDGSSDQHTAQMHATWITEERIQLKSVDDGGMILGDLYQVEERMWGKGIHGAVDYEYMGDPTGTRETTYQVFLLIVFRKSSSFERICDADITKAIETVTEQPQLLEPVMQYLSRTKTRIYLSSCHRLFQLIPFDALSLQETQEYLETLLGCLLASGAFPQSKVAETLLACVQRHGWSATTTAPIRKFLVTKMGTYVHTTALGLLQTVDMLLRWMSTVASGSEFLRAVVDQAVAQFQRETPFAKPTQRSSMEYVRRQPNVGARASYREIPPPSVKPVAEMLIQMSRAYGGWKEVQAAGMASFERLRRDRSSTARMLVQLADRLDAVKLLLCLDDFPAADHLKLQEGIVDDFLFAVLAASNTYPRRGFRGDLNLGDKRCEMFFRKLFEFGNEELTRRLATWAETAKLPFLHDVRQHVNTVANMEPCRALAAKDQCVVTINDLYTTKLQALVEATRSGEPEFTWAMPKARYPEFPAVEGFLISKREGPETFVVNDGLRRARSIADDLSCLDEHYSVTASVTSGSTNKKASIVVTKTTDFHDAMTDKYNEDVKNLEEVQRKTQEPGDASPVASIARSDTVAGRPTRKRSRTTRSSKRRR